MLFVLISASMLVAFGLGIWIGLGYPGLYERYEDSGHRAPRKAPYEMLLEWMGRPFRRFMDWLVRKLDRA